MGASNLSPKIRGKTPTFLKSIFTQIRLSGYAYNFQNTTKHPLDFFLDFRVGHTPTKILIVTNALVIY